MSDWYLFKTGVRDALRPKKLAAALVLIALPVLIAILWRVFSRKGDFDPVTAYNTLAAGMVFGFILVILSVVFSTGVVSQEVEAKTIVYLLTRPVPRWRILLMRFLAALVAVTVTTWIAAILVALAVYGGKFMTGTPLKRDLLIVPVGALAYGALFLLVATVLNRPLLYGLVFAFGWESWVPSLPGNFQRVSLMSYIRVLAPHPKPPDDTMDITALLSSFNPQTISTKAAWETLFVVAASALLCALLVFSNGEYVPREDAE